MQKSLIMQCLDKSCVLVCRVVLLLSLSVILRASSFIGTNGMSLPTKARVLVVRPTRIALTELPRKTSNELSPLFRKNLMQLLHQRRLFGHKNMLGASPFPSRFHRRPRSEVLCPGCEFYSSELVWPGFPAGVWSMSEGTFGSPYSDYEVHFDEYYDYHVHQEYDNCCNYDYYDYDFNHEHENDYFEHYDYNWRQ